MKRIKVILPVALLLLTSLILLVISFFKSDANAPAFIAWHNQPLPPFLMAQYDSGAPNPFAGDKMWLRLMSRSSTNTPFVLYDLQNHTPLGELKNANAVVANHDHSKLLCYRHDPPSLQWKEKVSRIISKVTFGKIHVNTNTFTQPLWILDRQNNSARKIGEISQFQGSTSFFHPSPDSRRAYTVSSASDEKFFLCDLETEKLTSIQIDGQLLGWWDNRHLLIRDSGNNFILLDVDLHNITYLWTAQNLAQQLNQLGIPRQPDDLKVILNWNGHENDFYFDLTRNRPTDKPGPTPFLKADRATQTLKLLYPVKLNFNYKFDDYGDLDPTGAYYLYSGRKNGTGDGSVHLRNISNNTETLLVPPTVSAGNVCISHPRFYHDSVIYFRGKDLWRIDLTGSNNAPLFPIPVPLKTF